MAAFKVEVKKIRKIEEHPNADALELLVIDGYRCVVRKGVHKLGDLIAYIPEGAIVPGAILRDMGLWDDEANMGRLAGSEGTRVKAIKLRGIASQGLCLPVDAEEGEDLAKKLGIVKYEAPIPVAMAGEIMNVGTENTIGFDVENWKSYPDNIVEGDNVIITEKLHGTCTIVAVLPEKNFHEEAFGKFKNILIFSKGIGAKGLALKNNEKNKGNLYVRSTRKLIEAIDRYQEESSLPPVPHYFLGETIGKGVQDLDYGAKTELRLFSVGFKEDGVARLATANEFSDFLFGQDGLNLVSEVDGISLVPQLYSGPFSQDVLKQHVDGKTTLNANHIREGVVVCRASDGMLLKCVSDDYLLRKGGTEFN